MHVLTVAEMQHTDSETIRTVGVPAMVLMERAAWAAFQLIGHAWPGILSGRQPVLLLAGSGNNGGDALALARMLHLADVPVRLFALPPRTDAARAQAAILERLGLPIEPLTALTVTDLAACELLVDGLFGVGLSRPLGGDLLALVERLADTPIDRLALDIPSGLHGDTGLPLPTAIRATRTITFGFPKAGLLTDPAADFVGDLWVADIGLPAPSTGDVAATPKADPPPRYRRVVDPQRERQALRALGQRPRSSHKGDFGRVLLIGGSPTMPGAILMATAAALAAGPGYVTVALPEALIPTAATRFPGAMFQSLPGAGQSELADLLARASVVAIGPGLGQAPAARRLVEQVLADAEVPVILDADGLNLAAAHPGWVQTRRAATVLTPHAGEAGRWLGISSAEVQADRWGALDRLVDLTGATVILKGSRTLIGSPFRDSWVNAGGTPALARGGSGDLLTGLIAGLMAQAPDLDAAVRAAVWWHGAAAETAVATHGTLGTTWERVIEALSAARQQEVPPVPVPGLTRLA